MGKRQHPVRGDNLRRAVAQEAARLMAEHGIHDFLTAKRKAAERFGVTEHAALPKNVEIEGRRITTHWMHSGASPRMSCAGSANSSPAWLAQC